jgi:hypothetical protein
VLGHGLSLLSAGFLQWFSASPACLSKFPAQSLAVTGCTRFLGFYPEPFSQRFFPAKERLLLFPYKISPG